MTDRAVIGIDVGGTKTLCLLVNDELTPLKEIKFKTAPRRGQTHFTANLTWVLKELKQTAKAKKLRLLGVGAGCAGSVDVKNGTIKTAPNLRCLENYPLGKTIKNAIGADTVIGNDLHMGAYAEHQLGAAVGCSNVLTVFFGTGVGGAAIINNKLYIGASGHGGQVGCILAQPVGGREAALSHGILDRIASKAAIAGEALAMASKEWAPYLHEKVGTDLAKISWGMLARSIKHGDTQVEEMLRARLRVVGIALSNVVNFLNPEMLVLGGGLTEQMPKLVLKEVETGLHEYLMPEVREALKIRPAKLENRAVAMGAAKMALIEAPQ